MRTQVISAYRGGMDTQFFNAIRRDRPLGSLRIDRAGRDLQDRFAEEMNISKGIHPRFPDYAEAQVSVDLGSVDALRKVVQVGAGAIGAGFLAPIIAQADHRISFLDANQKLIDRLRYWDSYYVDIAGITKQIIDLHILNSALEPVAAMTEMIRASMVTTSVGHNILPKIAPLFATSIYLRMMLGVDLPVNFIFLENFPVVLTNDLKNIQDQLGPFKTAFYAAAGEHFANAEQETDFSEYMERFVGFSRAIGHYPAAETSPKEHDVPYCLKVAGSRHVIPIEAANYMGDRIEVPEMKLEDRYGRLAIQKLLAFNMPHALVAYLGFANGIFTTNEAMRNNTVRETFEKAVNDEIGVALAKQFDFDEDETRLYSEHTRSTFETFEDSVFRIGGDAARKLSPDDRLIVAARLCMLTNVPCPNIIKGIAAGIWYAINVSSKDDPKAIKFPETLYTAEDKRDYILREICKLDSEDPLYKLVITCYKRDFERPKS
ncbi:MAG: hypothetical protein WC527_08115 [Candidatus Margulisiibacteriota bacterium]